MAEKQNNKRHESTIDKYFAQTSKAYKHGLRKTRKQETIFRLQLSRLEIQTKTETKDSISILLTTAKPFPSQKVLLNQCKGINSFAISLLKQLENS